MTRTISPCATILRQMCYAIGVFALTLITPMSYAATNCYGATVKRCVNKFQAAVLSG